jgi:uncharacterized membrane protein
MLRSRAFTPAFRFFSGLAVFSLIAAVLVGFSSETQAPMDRILGPLTLGWKGGVGNHLAYSLFVSLMAVSAGIAGLLVAYRDADPEAEAEVLHAESVPLTRAPAGMSYLPAYAAAALIVTLIGTATESGWLLLGGLVAVVLVSFTWTLRAWAERATGDDAVNAELYHRFVDPLRLPVLALVSIGIVVLGLSRVLLALSKTGSIVVFAVVGAIVFGVAILLAFVPRASRYLLIGVIVVGALLVIAGGIIGGVVGERDFHHEGEEHSETTDAATEHALGPVVVVNP